MKTCSKCSTIYPSTPEFFYKHKINSDGEQLYKGKCKKCYSEGVNSNPNHKISSLKYYYKNTEKCNTKRFKNYIKHRTGVALCY